MAGSSMVMRTREAKLKALAASLAVQMAREANDPLYSKYKSFRDKFMAFKKTLQAKYGKRALVVARKGMMSSQQR
jgi:ribosomal protein S17